MMMRAFCVALVSAAVASLVARAAHLTQLPTVRIHAVKSEVPESGRLVEAWVITRSVVTAEPLTVSLRWDGGSATAGLDHAALPGSVVIKANAASVTLPFDVLSDAIPEDDEAVTAAVVGGAGYAPDNALSVSQRSIVIRDNDLRLRLVAVDSIAMEPGGDRGMVVVERHGALSRDVAYVIELTGTGANSADVDAIATSRSLPAGRRGDTIVVAPRPDGVAEPAEFFIVKLSTIKSGLDPESGLELLSGSGARVRLVDARLSVAIARPAIDEVEGATIAFRVTRTGDLSFPVRAEYTMAGTATNGADYRSVSSPGAVSFPAGSATADVPITILGDGETEPPETIVLVLQKSNRYATDSAASATLTVAPPPTVTIAQLHLAPGSIVGGSETVVTGTVSLTRPATDRGIVVGLSSSIDEVVLSASRVAVPVGQSSATFTLTARPIAADRDAVILATGPDDVQVTATVAVRAPSVVAVEFSRETLTPKSTVDSTTVTARVKLDAPAPRGGIALRMGYGLSLSTPSQTASVPEGDRTVALPVRVRAVATDQVAFLSASVGNDAPVQRTFTIRAPVVTTLSFPTAPIPGFYPGYEQARVRGLVRLSGAAPPTGLEVTVATSNTILQPPATSLLFPPGTDSGVVVVEAGAVALTFAVTVSTNRGGSAVVTLRPANAIAMTLPVSTVVGGGARIVGQVTFDGFRALTTAFTDRGVTLSSPVAFLCDDAGQQVNRIDWPAHSTNATFGVCTRAVVASTSVVLRMQNADGSDLSVPLEVRPP